MASVLGLDFFGVRMGWVDDLVFVITLPTRLSFGAFEPGFFFFSCLGTMFPLPRAWVGWSVVRWSGLGPIRLTAFFLGITTLRET